MPLSQRALDNLHNALNDALSSLRSTMQHPAHTHLPTGDSNERLDHLDLELMTTLRLGAEYQQMAETHEAHARPAGRRSHTSHRAAPRDPHIYEDMLSLRQPQDFRQQQLLADMLAGDPATEKRERDSMVRKIKKTIATRLKLIDSIKSDADLYEDKRKKIQEAYFKYVKAKKGDETEGTKDNAYEVLYNCLVDAGSTLHKLEVSILRPLCDRILLTQYGASARSTRKPTTTVQHSRTHSCRVPIGASTASFKDSSHRKWTVSLCSKI